MENLKKLSQLPLEYQERRSVYQAQYHDKTGNIWSITVDGQARQVHSLRKQLAIELSTEPLEPDEAKRLIEEARKKSHNPPNEPQEKVIEEAPRKSDNLLDKSQEEVVDQLFIKSRSLKIEYTLIKLAEPEQNAYRLKFIIDPSIKKGDPPHQYRFNLKGYDSTANVTCTTHRGRVEYRLSGQNSVSRSGSRRITTLRHKAGNIRNWEISAKWRDGYPAKYRLDGDFIVSLTARPPRPRGPKIIKKEQDPYK